MRMLVFVTDDGISPEGAGPRLVVEQGLDATLPAHPRSLNWKYFATVDLDDTLLAADRRHIGEARQAGQSFISPRLIFVPSHAGAAR
jgi:hypothetical protein